MQIKFTNLLTLTILSLGFLQTAPVNAALPTNSELKIGISQEFESLNPIVMSMSASRYMYSMVGRTPVTLDSKGKWVTQLVKTIPSLENGKAKLIEEKGQKKIIATWEIIEKAKWGDGKDLTCADFELARKVGSTNTVSVGEREGWTMIEKIEWNPKTPKICTFTYAKARWDFYQLAGFTPLPNHLEGPVFEKYKTQKEGYEKNSLYITQPTNPGLYNGPYLISEVKLGSHVAFIPNPFFYGEQPKIKKIYVKLISSTGTLEANLRSGTINMISSLGLDFDQATAFDKKVKSESLPYKVDFQPSITYEHIDMNLSNPILKDVRVRKALVYSINRDELTKSLFDGKIMPAIHNISPKDPLWYTQDPKKITLYGYSKRKAEKLLDEAGWKMGPNGIRMKDGQKLSITLITTAGNKTRELVISYLQGQWKQIGIDINLKTEPARVYFGETLAKRKFDGMGLFAWISSPESSPRSTLSSTSIPNEKNGWAGQNYTGWSNPKVDELLNKIDVEFSAKKRTEYVHEILKYYTEEIPVIPLYYRSDISVTPKNLKHYTLTGHQFSETNDVENWSLE